MLDKIPTTIVVPSEAQELDAELRRDVRRLQDAFAALRDMQDYQCPTDINSLNTEEIDRLTEERISRVTNDANLLPSEIAERIKKYKALHRAIVTNLHIISKVVATWPQALFAYSADVRNIIPTADIESIVSARCTRSVPPLAQEHARLVNDALAAIGKLRDFEQANNVAKMRLEVLAKMDAETFAGQWADDSIKKPVFKHDMWGQRLEVGRTFAESQYV